MKKLQILLLIVTLVACTTTPTTTYDRALERAQEVEIEQIDHNLYLATTFSTSIEYAKSQVLQAAYRTCMEQNLATIILVQGRVKGDKSVVYATQFKCTNALTPEEEVIMEKYPK